MLYGYKLKDDDKEPSRKLAGRIFYKTKWNFYKSKQRHLLQFKHLLITKKFDSFPSDEEKEKIEIVKDTPKEVTTDIPKRGRKKKVEVTESIFKEEE